MVETGGQVETVLGEHEHMLALRWRCGECEEQTGNLNVDLGQQWGMNWCLGGVLECCLGGVLQVFECIGRIEAVSKRNVLDVHAVEPDFGEVGMIGGCVDGL